MSIGWISLHRKFMSWEWYDDHKAKSLFIHCLLKANYKEKKWRGNSIPRGTFVTSYSTLSKETGLSTRELRTAFSKLEETGEIDKESTSVNSWVTVVNYDEYQGTDKGATKERQGRDKGATTTNKGNKGNKENNIPPTREEVEEYFQGRGDMILDDVPREAENFINHYEERDWKNTSGKKISSWKRQAATWNNNYIRFNEDRLENRNQQNGTINLEIPGAV